MKIDDLVKACGFEVLSSASVEKEVSGAYCCDLLSWVIGRAEEADALVTVMSNQNVIAVAVMADLPCVILAEGVQMDQNCLDKAKENDIAVLSSKWPAYQTALKIGKVLNQI